MVKHRPTYLIDEPTHKLKRASRGALKQQRLHDSNKIKFIKGMDIYDFVEIVILKYDH